MRDHMLGCAQFIPDVENERVMPLTKAKPFALGIPTRAYPRFEEKHFEHLAVDEFEYGDHTPAAMRDDFPREYDLTTMLNEAAGRCMLTGDWGLTSGSADLTTESLTEILEGLARQIESVCGVNDMVLRANASTLCVGVDLGKPGGDMSAVAVRRGPEMSYPSAWDSLFPPK